MSSFGRVMPFLYMAIFIVIGWRLYVIRWDWRLKVASGVAMVIAPPLLFLLPALLHPERPFADLLLATGVGMLVAGAACLLGGMAGAWLRQRSRKA